jgi:phosphohistidine phosphatase
MRDADRALTSEGEKKLKDVMKRARAAGCMPSVIVTSPYLRARQTAEIAARELQFGESLVEMAELTPMSAPLETWSELRAFRDEEAVMLVGHEPHMGLMTAFVLGTPELLVDFKKGALVRVDVPGYTARPRGVLKWMIAPKLAG